MKNNNVKIDKSKGIKIDDEVLSKNTVKKSKNSIKELFSDYKDDYKMKEYPWGETKVRELL